MAGKVNIAGTWHRTPELLTKINGSWHAASTAYVKVSGSWRQWFTQTILDSFTRTTSGSLGNTDINTPWTAVNGVWYANGS